MKLPNGLQAIIDRRKLDDYCLSPTHPDGRNKARVFKLALGLDQTNATVLLQALRSAAIRSDAKHGKVDQYGRRYTVDFEFHGPTGVAKIRSPWIIGKGEDAPRLTTCYVLPDGPEATSP
ncbi:MAG: hypothetical protein OXQ90_00175 [Gammaproteobacteria bacterium]|nr:hypothetical protein [Gammaproteobacteria bacterium]